MMHTPLEGHGASGLTAADIGTGKAKVQSPANWTDSASIYTMKSNGFYATFIIPSMGRGFLTARLNGPEEEASAGDGYTELNLTASVNKPVSEVLYIKVVFDEDSGSGVRFFHNTNSIDIGQNVPIPDDLQTPCQMKYGATVISESIFGDRLETNVECTVLLKGETQPPLQPTPAPSIPPVPSQPPQNTAPPSNPPAPTPLPTPPPAVEEPVDDDEEPEPEFIITRTFIEGAWEHWGDVDRFLALESINIGITGMGHIDRVAFRMSPELEAMQYTNSSGHSYDYADDFFGEYVYFPQDSTVYTGEPVWGGRLYSWSYKLPLCPETITWEGSRVKEPYQIKALVYGRDGTVETVSMPLDITGTIYELIHPQPAD